MEYPVCVDVCPTKALELVALEDLDGVVRQKRRSVVEHLAPVKRKGLVILDLESDSAL